VLVGMEIPLVMRALNQGETKFSDLVGRVLTFDYLGALAVSLLFPLLLAPRMGLARTALARFMRGRAFLDALYRPADSWRRPVGETIVCRCEAVSAREIVETVALGCEGPNQLKALTRCGMGPCQGRSCGLTVTELIAQARGVDPQLVGYFRIRPPVKPITVAALAALPKSEAAARAVVRS